jgi:hypothetical protein
MKMFYSCEDIRAENIKVYSNVNFLLLPTELQNAYESNDYFLHMKLNKLSPFLEYYEKFAQSHLQLTSRDIPVIDYNDVIAYMIKNSRLEINPMTKEIKTSIAHFEKISRDSVEKIASELFEKVKEEKSAIFIASMDQGRVMHQKTIGSIKKVGKFLETYRAVLKEKFLFAGEKQIVVETKLGILFNQLPFNLQMEIASMENLDENILLCRPSLFCIIYKKLHPDAIFSKELSFRHPYLILLRSSVMEIVGLIVGKCPDRETIMYRCREYSKITSFSENSLFEKCLQSMNSPEIKICFTDALRIYD